MYLSFYYRDSRDWNLIIRFGTKYLTLLSHLNFLIKFPILLQMLYTCRHTMTKILLYLCVDACTWTCSSTSTYACGSQRQIPVSQSPFIFSDKISHWTRNTPIWLNRSDSTNQRSFCLFFSKHQDCRHVPPYLAFVRVCWGSK